VVKSGRVTVLGSPAGASSLRHQIGYLTQAPSVYPDLTVRENAHYFASLYKGVSKADADETIAAVGLGEAAGQLVRDLSGGQMARASLACTLVSRPEVLILDEPTVGQDPVLRDELWQQFRAAAASGTTVLISSHVMDEAGRCDRLLLIRDGYLVADETPAAIQSATQTTDLEAAFLHLIRTKQTVMSA
jgi:ABC-2 type transport system ATP-binding protein